jgi:type II secretory pathway pseudopilin PulG
VKIREAQGFALIDLLFVIGIIGIIAAIAIPRLLLAKQSVYAASAIGSLRAINSGELTYAITCGSGFYSPALTNLGTPPPGGRDAYVSPDLTVADTLQKSGYIIQLSAEAYGSAPPSCNGLGAGQTGRGYKAGADVANPGSLRFFATNAGGFIYEDTASLYAAIGEYGDPPSGHILK